VYDIVNVGDLAGFAPGTTVTRDALVKAGVLNATRGAKLKVLGDGTLSVALTVVADKFSKSAETKISGAGGSCKTPEPAAAAPKTT
jgi:large subunit ribosomal protein L15